ncbi:MAG TPA: hypothetical protein VL727_22815 [Puia sp.]|nr:hypothetical protein [Puia sp.]
MNRSIPIRITVITGILSAGCHRQPNNFIQGKIKRETISFATDSVTTGEELLYNATITMDKIK